MINMMVTRITMIMNTMVTMNAHNKQMFVPHKLASLSSTPTCRGGHRYWGGAER
jgi:type IV secretory pathway VirB3-like protein